MIKDRSSLLDVGVTTTTTGHRVFAALKGACDGGLDVPHNHKRFAGYDKEAKEYDAEAMADRIKGAHVSEYMEKLMDEDNAKYQQLFSSTSRRAEPDGLEDLYTSVHEAIREDPRRRRRASSRLLTERRTRRRRSCRTRSARRASRRRRPRWRRRKTRSRRTRRRRRRRRRRRTTELGGVPTNARSASTACWGLVAHATRRLAPMALSACAIYLRGMWRTFDERGRRRALHGRSPPAPRPPRKNGRART